MKFKIKYLLAISILALISMMMVRDYCSLSHHIHISSIPTDFLTPQLPPDSDRWNHLVQAIINVESEGVEDTINENSGASGVLQIMPVYVQEANRILGVHKFTLKDRFNREASVRMFNVIQDYHNPSHNIQLAIKLHNPNAGAEYYNRVICELKNQEI